MKTVFINGSSKKKAGASAYLLQVQKLFVRSKKVKENLRGREDHARILENLKDADAVVFSLPLYFDGIPSHVLEFLEKLQEFCNENSLSLKVYAISNGGFIEGKPCTHSSYSAYCQLTVRIILETLYRFLPILWRYLTSNVNRVILHESLSVYLCDLLPLRENNSLISIRDNLLIQHIL